MAESNTTIFSSPLPEGWEPPKELDSSQVFSSPIASAEDPGIGGYRAAVEKYRPQAAEIAAKEPSIYSYTPRMPFVAPLMENITDVSRAATGQGEGQTFEERRRNLSAGRQALYEERGKAHPLGSVVGETISGIATLPLTPELGIARGFQKLGDLGSPTVKLAKDYFGKMVESGAWGGLGAVSETKPGETVRETAERTALGTAAGMAVPPVLSVLGAGAKVLGKPIANAAHALWDPEAAAVARIAEKAKTAPTSSGRGMTIEEYKKAVEEGRPVAPIDIHGVKAQVEEAGGRFPEDTRFQEIRDFLADRFKGQTQRIHQDVDDAFGKKIDAFERRLQSDIEAKQVNGPAYRKAFSAPGADAVTDPNIMNYLNTSEGQEAVKWAANESKKWSAQKKQPGPASPFVHDNTGTPILDDAGNLQFREGASGPSLEFLDLVKRGLTTIGKQQPGETGGSTRGLAKQLADDLKVKFTDYETALNGSGKYIRGNNAFDAGEEFMNMALQGRGPKSGDFSRQMGAYNHPDFTPQERMAFQEGMGNWIKENPLEAAKLFKKGDKVFIDPIKKVLGPDKFEKIDASMTVNRMMAMIQTVTGKPGAAEKFITSAKDAIPAVAAVAGPYAASAAKLVAPLAGGPISLGIGAAGLSASALNYVGGSRRMNQLLEMAVSDDPRIQQMVIEAASRQKSTAAALKELEDRLGRYIALRVGQEPEGNQSIPVRAARKAGGRVSDRLIREVERAKKSINSDTESLLNTPDSHVAHALEIANRNLEG